MFRNRSEAGKALAARLGPLDPAHTVVLALPRGGVPVAAEICSATGAPLDIMLTRKIGAPHQPELAIGAIVDGEPPEIVINQDVAKIFGLDRDGIERLAALEHPELERRRKLYLSGRDPLPFGGTVTVLVDDGIATGATARAAIAALRHRGAAKVIFAVPVAPSQTVRQMRDSVDELVCLETPTPFFSVGEHYQNFEQVEDEEVIALLNAYREPRRAQSTPAAHGRS